MEHHVYSVWDFMSLAKSLQQAVAPADFPWIPRGNSSVRRFINAIMLEEESDEGMPCADGSPTYASHFELYCQAMREVNADPSTVLTFLDAVRCKGVHAALDENPIPQPARQFVRTTFGFIETGKPHVVAAAFAMGRENIIPGMFRALLKELGVTSADAPAFHYYLERHIYLDQDFHGPFSLLMLNALCAGDPVRIKEAEEAAVQAVEARLTFWDGVTEAIAPRRGNR